MEYTIRVPKITGEVVPLFAVVDAMAKAKATTFGTTDFHKPTYDGAYAAIGESLLLEVQSKRLTICDQNGFALSDLAQATLAGSPCDSSRKYVVEPDWESLKKQHPDAEVGPGMWNWTGIDLGETEVDAAQSKLISYQTSLHFLNEWGGKTGNVFHVADMPVEMKDFDLKNEKGEVIKAGYFRGFVGQMTQADVHVGEADPAKTIAVPNVTIDGKPSQEAGEPYMQKGRNVRAAVKKWVEWQAGEQLHEGDTNNALAERIRLIAERYGYESQREALTASSIARMIPSGLTGGRGKAKSTRNNMPPIAFDKADSKAMSARRNRHADSRLCSPGTPNR